MMLNIQRAAVGLGLLLAGAMFWASMAYRHVSRERFVEMVEAREAELGRLMRPEFVSDVDREDRLGAAVVAARSMLSLPEFKVVVADSPDSMSTPYYRSVISGRPYEPTVITMRPISSVEECDRLLARPEVVTGIRRMQEGGHADVWESPTRSSKDDDRRRSLVALNSMLSLSVAQAVHRGEEEPVVFAIERLAQHAQDLLADRDPGFDLIGAHTLHLAFTSAYEIEFRAMHLQRRDKRDAHLAEAVDKLLRVVTSELGRERIAQALLRAAAWLPSRNDEVLVQCKQSVRALLQRADEEHPNSADFPYAYVQDLRALTDWQDELLDFVQNQALPVAEGRLSLGKETLPPRARSVIPNSWYQGRASSQVKGQTERALRRITAGKAR